MGCCGKPKKPNKAAVAAATKKATIRANHLAAIGKIPKPKKQVGKKKVPPATKTKPCTPCGKNKAKITRTF